MGKTNYRNESKIKERRKKMRRVCEACGNEIDNDFNYCRECGEIVELVDEDEDEDDYVEITRCIS